MLVEKIKTIVYLFESMERNMTPSQKRKIYKWR